jgi:glyoxylase I family protein
MTTQLTSDKGDVGMSAPSMHGVHHVDITATNVERSVAWYQRIFGFTRAFDEVHADGYVVVLAEPRSGLFLGVNRHDKNGGERFDENRTGLDHVSFRVATRADLDEWQEWLVDNDVEQSPIADAEEPFRYAVLVFRDPDNIQLELIWLGM